MKSVELLFVLMLGVTISSAQFNKGRMIAGGGVSFSRHEIDNGSFVKGSSTSFGVSPRFGYFFIDQLAGGLNLSISGSSFTPDTGTKSTTSGLNIGPFLRYYLDNGIFFHGNYGFGRGKTEFTSTEEFTSNEWGLEIGYAYFLNDFVSIEPSIGYNSFNRDYKSVISDESQRGITFLKIALQIYLGDRK